MIPISLTTGTPLLNSEPQIMHTNDEEAEKEADFTTFGGGGVYAPRNTNSMWIIANLNQFIKQKP